MNLSIEELAESSGRTALIIKGEIDVYTAPKLRDKLLPLCGRENHAVVVDLSGTTYVDSTGLGVFIGAYKASQTAGGDFVLTGMSVRVARLFKITGLDELITIENSQGQEDNQPC